MSPPVALVTGGSRGIGRAVARALAEAGHPVAVVARNAELLTRTAAELRDEFGASVLAIAADLGEPGAVARVVSQCEGGLGTPAIIVNNAGSAPSARIEDTTDEVLIETLRLHVKVPFQLLRELLPHLRRAGTGTMIQIASSAGLRGFPFTVAYTAAKHAMVGLTRALAAELGADSAIRTYAVCPGFVDTAITRAAARAIAARGNKTEAEAFAALAAQNRIGRMHTPDEVAAAVLRLCEDRPEGTVLDLDADPPTFV